MNPISWRIFFFSPAFGALISISISISMATAVLSAQDCLGCEERGISISARRSTSRILQTGSKSGKVSAPYFSNANTNTTFEYASPGKNNSLTRNCIVADQKRPLKSKVPDEVLGTKLNSEGRIYRKSSNVKMGEGRSMVRAPTAKGEDQLERVGRDFRILTSAPDVQFAAHGESCAKDFHSEKWAGPAFVNSPSPSCLPFPKFSVKKCVQLDSSATRDLRQLLGLG